MLGSVPLVSEPSIDAAQFAALRDRALVAPMAAGVVGLSGNGAVDCLQGLLTNDIAKPGPDSIVYGALLTPKGMIVADLWAFRTEAGFTLVVPQSGHAAAMEILHRTLPPRLARSADLSATHRAAMVFGGGADAVVAGLLAPGEVPAAGRMVRAGQCLVGAIGPGGPFQYLIVGPAEDVDRSTAALLAGGAANATDPQVTAARIVAGWPAHGHEIDEKTLPQEVRFDEIGGVSYTKGCYTGQETVARVHFRGHPNRELRAIVWDGMAPLVDRSIQHLGREVGTVRSNIVIAGRRVGLAPVRREVQNDEMVTAGGSAARVVALPLAASTLER
jgi:folate-binding protein YgfZ